MSDLLDFTLSLVMLLLVPGPTNTLLMSGGATGGYRHGLMLVVAETTAYLISVTFLTLVVSPVVASWGPAILAMRIACGLYLLWLAYKLARSVIAVRSRSVSFVEVLLTTLMNPKGLVIALSLMPPAAYGTIHPAWAILAASTYGVGSLWATAGASLGPIMAKYIQVGGAVVLAGFGLFLAFTGLRAWT